MIDKVVYGEWYFIEFAGTITAAQAIAVGPTCVFAIYTPSGSEISKKRVKREDIIAPVRPCDRPYGFRPTWWSRLLQKFSVDGVRKRD